MAKKAKSAPEPGQPKYRSRIKEFIPSFPTAQLIEHPENWRLHPEQQKQMLAGLLDRYGKIDAIIAYQSEKYGGLVIIDGHQRHDMDAEYPVIVLDVTDSEASEILMTYNPIAEMSVTDKESYRQLMAALDESALKESEALAALAGYVLDESISVSSDPKDTVIKKVEVKPPAKYVWAVVGIPVADFGSVNGILEQLHIVDGVIIETTASDWKP